MNVTGANLFLKERVKEFKSYTLPKRNKLVEPFFVSTARERVNSFNDILFDAIANYPTEVNAVKVSSTFSLKELTDYNNRLYTTYDWHVFRQYFNALFDKSIPSVVDYDFVLPLPFNHYTGVVSNSFSTKSHSVRQGGSFFDNIEARLLSLPYINLRLGSSNAGLLFNNINSVELVNVDDDNLSPVIDFGGNLAPCGSSVNRYLNFRGFFKTIGESVSLPEMGTYLLDYINMNKGVLDGFVVVNIDSSPVLYEFKNFNYSGNFGDLVKISIPSCFNKTKSSILIPNRFLI